MKYDLIVEYEWEDFKAEFYKQHPDGDFNQLYYCWNTYIANRCSNRRRLTTEERNRQ